MAEVEVDVNVNGLESDGPCSDDDWRCCGAIVGDVEDVVVAEVDGGLVGFGGRVESSRPLGVVVDD